MKALEFGPADRELFLKGAGERSDKLRARLAPGVFEGSVQAGYHEKLLARISEGSLLDVDGRKLPGRGANAVRGLWNRMKKILIPGQEIMTDLSTAETLHPQLAAGVCRLARLTLDLEHKWLLAVTVCMPPEVRALLLRFRRRLRPTTPQVGGGGAQAHGGERWSPPES